MRRRRRRRSYIRRPGRMRKSAAVPYLPWSRRRKRIGSQDGLIIVGNVLGDQYDRSEIYNPAFTTEFRKASLPPDDRSSGNPGTSDRGNVMYIGAADHTNGTHFREEDTV